MDATKALERDWSLIPRDLLNCIANCITEISDFLRYRAVCSAWRSSIQITDLPPQFPWLFQTQTDSTKDDLAFFSITFSKTYSIRTTKFLHKCLCGPSEGYMLARGIDHRTGESTSHCSLLNPLRNHEIPLPLYTYQYWFDGCNSSWIGPRQNQMMEYVAFQNDLGLPVCHLGQKKWREFCFVSRSHCSYFCLKGMIFGAEKLNGITTVIDIKNSSQYAYVIPPVEGHSTHGKVYIVEASGYILRVFQHSSQTYSINCEFDVHRLDVSENNSAAWIKVNNIGNQAIFIDFFGALVIKASEIAGIKSNCIYFLKKIQSRKYGVIRIDIETSAKEVLQCPFEEPHCWYMPNFP